MVAINLRGEMQISKTTYMEKVQTSEDVREIREANRQVISLTAAWFRYIRSGDHSTAARIRWEISRIKQRILSDYDIIL